MKHGKDGKRPRIHGNLVSIVLQRAHHIGGMVEVFKVARECLSGLEADQIEAIALNKAYLDGNNIDGLVYIERQTAQNALESEQNVGHARLSSLGEKGAQIGDKGPCGENLEASLGCKKTGQLAPLNIERTKDNDN